MTPLVDRLKERKLVQWALAYLAGAWLVLQVFGELRENFGWSPLFGRVLTVLLAVGLLAALVVAWYHGEKGRQRVSGPELLMLGVLLVAAVGATWVGQDVEFTPGFAWPYYNLSTISLLQGRREDARRNIQRMLAATRDAPEALIFAGHTAVAMGDLSAARRYFERGLPRASSWDQAHGAPALAWILQQAGEAERARELVRDAARRFESRWGGDPRRLEDYVDLARIRVLEGDREGALWQMEEAVRQGWRFIYERPNDPILNSLRGEPRFDRLMAQVKADVDRQRARVEREGW